MNPSRFVAPVLLACAAILSCADDPVQPTGSNPLADEYEVRLESFGGRIDAVWGRSASDVYAGADMLFHFDGDRWTPIPFPREMSNFSRVWGTASGDLMLANSQRIYRFDGNVWDYVAIPGGYAALHGLPTGEAFVVSDAGIAHRFDGTTWSSDSIATDVRFRGIHATSSRNVFAVGEPEWFATDGSSFIAHYDGTRWNTVAVDSLYSIFGVVGLPDGTAVVLGAQSSQNPTVYRYESGQPLTPIGPGNGLQAQSVWGSANDLYVGGYDDYGVSTYRYDGTAWTRTTIASPSAPRSGWTAPTGEIFTAGYSDGLWKTDATSSERALGGGSYEIEGLWTSPQGDVFACGGRVLRFDGERWHDLNKEAVTTQRIYALDGTGNDDFYAVGSGVVLHYDGEAWDWVSGGFQRDLYDVAVDGNRVFAVGRDAYVVHFNGHEWLQTITPAPYSLLAVDAWDGGAVAVGADGAIVRCEDGVWYAEESPVTWWLFGVVAFSPRDIIAVGESPWEIVVYDGRSWKRRAIESYRATGRGNGSEAIWGRSSNDFYVAQWAGTIQHFAGGTWSELPHVLGSGVLSVAGSPRGDVFVATRESIVSYRLR